MEFIGNPPWRNPATGELPSTKTFQGNLRLARIDKAGRKIHAAMFAAIEEGHIACIAPGTLQPVPMRRSPIADPLNETERRKSLQACLESKRSELSCVERVRAAGERVTEYWEAERAALERRFARR